MKIALIVGHNSLAQGAVRVTDGQTEWVWNGRLAGMINGLAPSQTRIFHRIAGPGEIANCYREAADWGCDCTVELHFNSFSASSATGTETLHAAASTAGRELAQRVQRAMVAALGLRDRGLLPIARNGRGGAALHAIQPPAILVEPYFGSNRADCVRTDDRMGALARAILEGAGGRVESDTAPTPPTPAPTEDDRLAALERRVQALEAIVAQPRSQEMDHA
jgi:N-acetylmuramoyl-L-alanine amidase